MELYYFKNVFLRTPFIVLLPVFLFFSSCVGGGNKPAKSVGGDEPAKSVVSSVRDLKIIEDELDAMNTEILDTVEIADRMCKSLRSSEYNTLVFSNGWVFYLHNKSSDDDPLPYFPAGVCDNFLYRVRLSDFKADSILCNNNYSVFYAVDKYWVFFMELDYLDNQYTQGLYKQHIRSNERTLLKKINYGNINNVIVFKDRVYFTQAADSIGENREGRYIIACVKTDGSDDKILTKPFYRDFCIYKGMIFARNDLYELEKLDLNGSKMDSYGKIGGDFFDIYDDYIYYVSENDDNIYKIDINTKKKQLVYNTSFFHNTSIYSPFENCFIAHNCMFFISRKSSIRKEEGIPIALGDLYCLNLKTGKMKKIYSEHDCELTGLYNGVLYGKEFVMSDAKNNKGSLIKFQINMDGTGKRNFQ